MLSAQILLRAGLPWVYVGAVSCGAILSLYTLLVLRNDTHLCKNEDEEDLLEEKQMRKKSDGSRGNGLRYIKVPYQLSRAPIVGYHKLIDFQDMLVTCFRPRDNHIRTIISLLIADKLISDLGIHSEQGIVYIFSKEKFNWTEQEYSTFKAISTCTRGLGTMMMTPFLKMMRVSDPIISYLGILSSTVSYYFCGLSLAPWMLWMAATLGSFRSMTTAVAR